MVFRLVNLQLGIHYVAQITCEDRKNALRFLHRLWLRVN
jgi:hypothetical protein